MESVGNFVYLKFIWSLSEVVTGVYKKASHFFLVVLSLDVIEKNFRCFLHLPFHEILGVFYINLSMEFRCVYPLIKFRFFYVKVF